MYYKILNIKNKKLRILVIIFVYTPFYCLSVSLLYFVVIPFSALFEGVKEFIYRFKADHKYFVHEFFKKHSFIKNIKELSSGEDDLESH